MKLSSQSRGCIEAHSFAHPLSYQYDATFRDRPKGRHLMISCRQAISLVAHPSRPQTELIFKRTRVSLYDHKRTSGSWLRVCSGWCEERDDHNQPRWEVAVGIGKACSKATAGRGVHTFARHPRHHYFKLRMSPPTLEIGFILHHMSTRLSCG